MAAVSLHPQLPSRKQMTAGATTLATVQTTTPAVTMPMTAAIQTTKGCATRT